MIIVFVCSCGLWWWAGIITIENRIVWFVFLEETEETDVEKQKNKHKTKKKTENQFKDGRTVQPNF